MKRNILISIFALYSWIASSATVVILNSGFTFSPAEVTINLGDTVVFQLAGSHNAAEVSESTWAANGTTQLQGGFSVPFGGGTITGLSEGVHFYVCQPHASLGMKGKITVTGNTGIPSHDDFDQYFKVYPNPLVGVVHLDANSTATNDVNQSMASKESSLQVYNILGERVYEIQNFDLKRDQELDLSSLPDGSYILRISAGRKVLSKILVKN